MKHLRKFLCGIILLPSVAFCQSNFRPGYVVTASGDTLKGTINYREWDTNPSQVNFRDNAGKDITLTPANTRYFEATGLEAYLSYSGNISKDETNENRVQNGRDTSFVSGSYFLKVLQQGKVISIYSYIDGTKPRYFYATPASPAPKELVYRVYYDTNKAPLATGRTVNENTYIEQLSAVALQAGVMDDRLQQMMNDIDYNKIAILKVTSKMNGEQPKQAAKVKGADALDLYAGVGVNAVTTTPTGNFQKNGAGPYTAVLPRLLLGFSAYANPNVRKLVFNVDLGVALGKYQTTFDNKAFPYANLDYHFNQLIISLTPNVMYNFYNAPNFKVFAAIGFDVSHYSYSNKTYRRTDGTEFNYGAVLFNFHTFVNSGIAKVGLLINKRYQVYANYVQGGYITTFSYETLKQNTVQAGVNYYFGK